MQFFICCKSRSTPIYYYYHCGDPSLDNKATPREQFHRPSSFPLSGFLLL